MLATSRKHLLLLNIVILAIATSSRFALSLGQPRYVSTTPTKGAFLLFLTAMPQRWKWIRRITPASFGLLTIYKWTSSGLQA